MADVKISALPASTTPLAGTEVLPLVQGGATKQVSIANVTAGRAVSALSLASTNDATINGLTAGKGNSSIATNTVLGVGAGGKFATGGTSVAIGNNAFFNATGINSCVAIGDSAGYSLVANNQNTFVGSTAGYTSTGYGNTFIGCNAFTGQGAGYNQGPGLNNTIIGGYGGSYGLSNYIWLSDGVGNVRLTCFPSGGVSIGNTTDPGAGVLAVNSGVRFSATQVPSADVNTLDDYEEGTWTPTFTGWTTAPTVYYATYTKIGRTVTINLYASGGVVAYSSIGGLPFTSSAMGASVIAVRVSGYDVAFYGTVGASSTTINSVNQINTLIAQNWALSFTYTTD